MNERDDQRDLGAPTPSMIMRPLSRHAESPGAADAVERRAGRLLANVADPPALDRAAFARVQARLFGSSAAKRARAPFGLGRLALGSTFGAVALLASGAVVAGVGVFWRATHHQTRPAATESAAPSAAPRPRARVAKPAVALARADVASAVASAPAPATVPSGTAAPLRGAVTASGAPAPPAPGLAPPPATTETAPAPFLEATPPARPASARLPQPRGVPSPARGSTAPDTLPFESARPAPIAAPVETAPGALARETRLLGQALKQLRQRRDGAAALALLDDYAGRFPAGTLAAEARRARIDALLLLDRRDEALRSLEAANLEPVGRGQELLVIRGELRGRADCAAAIADFDLALGRAAPPALGERALFGRAICAARLGRSEAARADARAYLTRYPAGRFAAAAGRISRGESAAPSKD